MLLKEFFVGLMMWHLLLFIVKTDASTEYNRYLAHIFQKYGSGGTMSFEGLEHLMYSLGLGQIEFDPKHTLEAHYPLDAKMKSTTINRNNLKTFFESQTIKLNDENDIQILDNTEKQQIHEESARKTKEKIEDHYILEFKELHDPKHRHPRENNFDFDESQIFSNICLSPKSLLHLVVDHDDLHKRKFYKNSKTHSKSTLIPNSQHNIEEEYNEFINNVRLTPVAFMKLCPALLAQIDQHVCVTPAPITHDDDPKNKLWNAWIYASISIFILSACGLLGILLVPLMKSSIYQDILKFLVAVAVGTLAGDALMHLLPHALTQHNDAPVESTSAEPNSNSHEHDNNAIWVCGCAFLTTLFMYTLEHLLPLLKRGSEGEHHGHHGHGHSHHNHMNNDMEKQKPIEKSTIDIDLTTKPDSLEGNIMLDELKKDQKKPSKPLTPVAFMVIIGDALHNLTDGLAIGAAFASDPVTGMATAFAVLCHELPHELGDFALLLQTGVSIKRAIYLNIVSSVLSFLGMAAGLLIAGLHSNLTQWIYASTAGSFLYIAFADLMPAMIAESATTGKKYLINRLTEIVGMATGGVIMLLIAVNEHDLEELFQ